MNIQKHIKKISTTRESQHLWFVSLLETQALMTSSYADLLYRRLVEPLKENNVKEVVQHSARRRWNQDIQWIQMIKILVWWWWGRFFILNGTFMKILEDIEYRVTWRCLIRVFQVNPISAHGGSCFWHMWRGWIVRCLWTSARSLSREAMACLGHCTEISLMLLNHGC